MFIYLAKKIPFPDGTRLRCVAWNGPQGYIACGGDNGLTKVLKLEATKDNKVRGLAAASTLTMNQNLVGHEKGVLCAAWNENYRKLCTSDERGCIIVWMLYRGSWYEEMVNNRNKSLVTDMRWTTDGQRICICYLDGMVIVGTVGGSRIWGNNIEKKLVAVDWSPDGKFILFGTEEGEVHIHDALGVYLTKVPILCNPDKKGEKLTIAGIHWYNGTEGYLDANQPVLCVVYDNGRVQIGRSETDDQPVLIDTHMRILKMAWNKQGTLLAIAGKPPGGQAGPNEKEMCALQLYTPWGDNVTTLKVPGTAISGLSWSGTGLRISMAVDAALYFANIRPDYKWGYFANTLVYSYLRPERTETCITFWNTVTKEKFTRTARKVLWLRAAGDYCIVITRTDEVQPPAGSGQPPISPYIVVLFDAIGTAHESRYMDIEPLHTFMTKTHIIVASDSAVFVWQYNVAAASGAVAQKAKQRKEIRDKLFHIDDQQGNALEPGQAIPQTRDTICAVAASDRILVVGRESGTVQRYSLPQLSLEARYQLRGRPQMLAVNCDSSRMSIIDINGVMTFFELDRRTPQGLGLQLEAERGNVWDMRWADDNPTMLCAMEKTKMYVFRGPNLEPDDPTECSAYICTFKDLVVTGVLLDEIMYEPENPDRDVMQLLETRSLRDTRGLLATTTLTDTIQFVTSNPHPRLWRIVAEAALEKLDLGAANTAFIKYEDYQGIQFVKRLRKLDDPLKQQAEVAAFFGKFEDAERMYLDMDRADLAIDLRVRLGDWFRVVKLVQTFGATSDALLTRAQTEIGDYFAERQKWDKAIPFYEQAHHMPKLADALYFTERYRDMGDLIAKLNNGDALLQTIGERFVALGMWELARDAYVKAGNVEAAINACVQLNQWSAAVDLAERTRFGTIDALFSKYAAHLMDQTKTLSAIELYHKAKHHAEAARLLLDLARTASVQKLPVRAKKLYVLAALSADLHAAKPAPTASTSAAGALDSLLNDTESLVKGGALEYAWRGAEAYHFSLLAQKQLYEKKNEMAMITALRLREYEDLLDPREIYSLIALTAYTNQYYSQCSKAFIKLENLESLSQQERDGFVDLAFSIFTKYPPKDRKTRTIKCPNAPSCSEVCYEWTSSCEGCGAVFPACVGTGRTLFTTARTTVCPSCKHRCDEELRRTLEHCPLCHA